MIDKEKRMKESAELKQVIKNLGTPHRLTGLKRITNNSASKLPKYGIFYTKNQPIPQQTYIIDEDAVVEGQSPYNANAAFIHRKALKDREDMIELLDSEMTNEELEAFINEKLEVLRKLDETATNNATFDLYVMTLNNIKM